MEWILGRTQKARKNRQAFSPNEDEALRKAVAQHGDTNWVKIASMMPHRNPRQCRERWRCYLRPELTNKQWTIEEDTILMNKYSELGPKWSAIAHFLPNRSEINIKSRFKLLGKCMNIPNANQNFYYPTMVDPRSYDNAFHMHKDIQPGMNSSESSGNKSASSESSTESSAPDKENLNTPQDLEAFFSSLNIGHLKNTPKFKQNL